MKVVGSVGPEEIPQVPGKSPSGVWTHLAKQAIDAHAQGKVLVVKAADREEYKRMVNGMSEKLRNCGYRRSFIAVDEADGEVTVYCRLDEREVEPASVVVKPLRRPKRRANA